MTPLYSSYETSAEDAVTRRVSNAVLPLNQATVDVLRDEVLELDKYFTIYNATPEHLNICYSCSIVWWERVALQETLNELAPPRPVAGNQRVEAEAPRPALAVEPQSTAPPSKLAPEGVRR